MPTVNTKHQDIARWVDEGGAGPDLDNVQPPALPPRSMASTWVLGGAVLACAGLAGLYFLRRA